MYELYFILETVFVVLPDMDFLLSIKSTVLNHWTHWANQANGPSISITQALMKFIAYSALMSTVVWIAIGIYQAWTITKLKTGPMINAYVRLLILLNAIIFIIL
ncbi:hypothetical protein [uncultured Shewanella sp.]|uniref:hypothetical protein n=1 Tax=uncultured Shewanella sp. TaxID=173975 RepID=UPI00261C2804|nr:hypothetical protein [uncultured Shewanella sp.]